MISAENIGVIILLFVIAVFVEKIYVSRVSILPNLLVLLPLLISNWGATPSVFQFWAIGGLIFGIGAIYAYIRDINIPEPIHDLMYSLYSLKTILGIYISILAFGVSLYSFIIGIIFSVVIWLIAVKYFENELPFDLS